MREDYGKLYRKIHKGDRWYRGYTGCKYTDDISALVKKTKAKSLLDYGCGKGYQYLGKRVHEAWGILPYCFDVGVPSLSTRPTGTFDGVICTDVMEHIHVEDVQEVLADVFGFAEKFVFFSICTRPSGRLLPDGRGVHLTVETDDWWMAQIKPHRIPGLEVAVEFTHERDLED